MSFLLDVLFGEMPVIPLPAYQLLTSLGVNMEAIDHKWYDDTIDIEAS
jgi:hypothetical protein